MIKNVIFDFGGVLVDWNPRYLYSNIFEDKEQMEYFLMEICSSGWNAELDRGRSFDDGISELKVKFPDYSKYIQLYKDGWEKMIGGDFPETVKLLNDFKREGYALYGLTNWSAETIPFAYSRFPFFKEFEGIVVSGEEKISKPEPEIYNILLERYNLVAEECLFIDDNINNVLVARKLGINAVIFKDINSLRKEIKQYL